MTKEEIEEALTKARGLSDGAIIRGIRVNPIVQLLARAVLALVEELQEYKSNKAAEGLIKYSVDLQQEIKQLEADNAALRKTVEEICAQWSDGDVDSNAIFHARALLDSTTAGADLLFELNNLRITADAQGDYPMLKKACEKQQFELEVLRHALLFVEHQLQDHKVWIPGVQQVVHQALLDTDSLRGEK